MGSAVRPVGRARSRTRAFSIGEASLYRYELIRSYYLASACVDAPVLKRRPHNILSQRASTHVSDFTPKTAGTTEFHNHITGRETRRELPTISAIVKANPNIDATSSAMGYLSYEDQISQLQLSQCQPPLPAILVTRYAFETRPGLFKGSRWQSGNMNVVAPFPAGQHFDQVESHRIFRELENNFRA